MTQAEWQMCAEPEPMIAALRGRVSDRTVLLFACACQRSIWHHLEGGDTGRRWTVAIEALVEGEIDPSQLPESLRGADAFNIAVLFSRDAALSSARLGLFDAADERRRQVGFLRDIFGFRPIAIDPTWLTSPVVDLARTMYNGRDFSPMPILADALEEAGCDNADVLAHCRGDGQHTRGCWVIDAILGKD